MANYNILDYSYKSSSGITYSGDSYSNSLGGSVFAGGRYCFTNNIAAFVEVGYGATFFNGGISFKF